MVGGIGGRNGVGGGSESIAPGIGGEGSGAGAVSDGSDNVGASWERGGDEIGVAVFGI